jgi:hypothetical protein
MEFTIAIWSFYLARAGQSGTILLPVTISELRRWLLNSVGRRLNLSANMALSYGWRTAILFYTSLPYLRNVLSTTLPIHVGLFSFHKFFVHMLDYVTPSSTTTISNGMFCVHKHI